MIINVGEGKTLLDYCNILLQLQSKFTAIYVTCFTAGLKKKAVPYPQKQQQI